MAEQPFSSQLGSMDDIDSKFRKAKVLVCTASFVFTGYTYRLHQQRLLDALNKGLVIGKSRLATDFVPLMDVEVISPDGKREHMPSTCFIGKSNIIFIAETDEGQADISDIPPEQRVYPYREKKAIATKVLYTPAYTLSGQMHTDMWQQLVHILDSDEKFLAMTNVEISPEPGTGQSNYHFVAINKDQITCVTEV